jgi:hypothetical protein
MLSPPWDSVPEASTSGQYLLGNEVAADDLVHRSAKKAIFWPNAEGSLFRESCRWHGQAVPGILVG